MRPDAAFAGVWAAALANGGSFDDIMPGIEYFADLKEQGILIRIAADDNRSCPARHRSCSTGPTTGRDDSTPSPRPASSGARQCRATACTARTTPRAWSPTVPHPNAGRLWIEHILSDEGALGYLEGGAIPARYATLVENGTITEDMLSALPAAELIEQVAFPTADQIAAAQAVLAENWGPMVADT